MYSIVASLNGILYNSLHHTAAQQHICKKKSIKKQGQPLTHQESGVPLVKNYTTVLGDASQNTP